MDSITASEIELPGQQRQQIPERDSRNRACGARHYGAQAAAKTRRQQMPRVEHIQAAFCYVAYLRKMIVPLPVERDGFPLTLEMQPSTSALVCPMQV